jgi:hypothetical protein
MNLENLPSRDDLESAVEMIHSLGWKTKAVGNFVEVRPSTQSPAVLVSALSYQFCGIWLRPIYTKLTVESFIDLDTIASVLLLTSFDEVGAVSVMEMDREAKSMTITYRLLIPSQPSERAYMAEGILAASMSGADLQKNLKRMHEHAKNGGE